MSRSQECSHYPHCSRIFPPLISMRKYLSWVSMFGLLIQGKLQGFLENISSERRSMGEIMSKKSRKATFGGTLSFFNTDMMGLNNLLPTWRARSLLVFLQFCCWPLLLSSHQKKIIWVNVRWVLLFCSHDFQNSLYIFKVYGLRPAPFWCIAYKGLIATRTVSHHTLSRRKLISKLPTSLVHICLSIESGDYNDNSTVSCHNSFQWVPLPSSYCCQYKAHTKLAIVLSNTIIQNCSGLFVDSAYMFFWILSTAFIILSTNVALFRAFAIFSVVHSDKTAPISSVLTISGH